MPTLILRHLEQPTSSDAPRFQLIEPGGDTLGPIQVEPAAGYPVEGRPNDELMSELRWYLEDFLEYPFHPETDHAERVLNALEGWAASAFEALFGRGDGASLFARLTANGVEKLRLCIESTDPRILSWPWETIGRAGAEPIGRLCRVERSLGGLKVAAPPLVNLPRDRVNILLVTARPKGELDVSFRSISRPMVDLVEEENLPIDVHVLRPPTFERLREHLEERPGHYHILHFDGHGAYRSTAAGTTSAVPSENVNSLQLRTAEAHQLKGYEGCLIFEDSIGADSAIKAPELSSLLSQHGLPIVVLNACQSAMLDETAETAFASVAASLIKAGTRSVVAMAYSLYVSAAQEFLPDFYRRLFTSGSVAEGVRAGRRRLAEKKGRICSRGRFDLEDWLVPVLYQQEDVDFSFAVEARARGEAPKPRLLDLDGEPALDYFVGRDGAILQLERAFRKKPAGVLIHGLGGVGKTTLARGFLEWLGRTEGLGAGCFWLSFQEVRSAEYVWNRLGERLVGNQFTVLEAEQKIAGLLQIFRENRFVIVWDNFEVVAGIEGTSAMPTLPATDRAQLAAFLTGLRGGNTKVIITSRSKEAWLRRERQVIGLSGLRGEERWSYCNRVLGELGLEIDRGDQELENLIGMLGGHPLAMRVILPELARHPAQKLIDALKSNLAALDLEEDDAAKLQATLGFAEEALPPKDRLLLVPLAFHERFVDGDHLEAMAEQVDSAVSRREIDTLLSALSGAGLLRDVGQSVFEMHPALTGFLRSSVLQRTADDARDPWVRAFVDFFGRLADELASREVHEQRGSTHLHSANFLAALEQAECLDKVNACAAILQALAVFAEHQHLFDEAAKLYQKLADLQQRHGNSKGEAGAYHQLGVIAQGRQNLDAAERWFRKSLSINESFDNEQHTAMTYYQLGSISEIRRDFDAAEKWLHKSLAISEKHGNERGSAATYHEFGIIAQQRRHFDAAEEWYRKSLVAKEKYADDHGAAITYHQLGIIAQERQNLDAAEKWLHKSLIIKEKHGDENQAASTYHQLGRVAQERKNLDVAEKWFRKSLIIKEKHGNENGAAIAYHQLGYIAQERQDFDTAEKWYRKSLAINERHGNEHGTANTYGQLGILAGLQQKYEESGNWLLRCILAFINVNDLHAAMGNTRNFMIFHKRAPPPEQGKLRSMWDEAGLPWPEDAPGG